MRTTKLPAAALAVLLFATACGADEDPGDPEAFCELLRDGVGLSAGGASRLDELEDVAPPEIRVAVRALANASRSLDEIPDAELAELFSAAFDPDAVQARDDLRRYAVDQCGSAAAETDGSPGGPADEVAADAEVSSYITDNFGTTSWASQLSIDAGFAFGRIDSISAEFRTEPAAPDDALAACNALAVYLYEIQEGSGAVEVRRGDVLLAGRSGPTGQCVRP